jgi:hypothetical protein
VTWSFEISICPAVNPLRALTYSHRKLALLFLAVTLLVKALVPSGYMIGGNFKTLTVQICADSSGGVITKQMAVPIKDGPGEVSGQAAKDGGICAFTALSFGSLAATDIELLAAALAFILALGFTTQAAPHRAAISWLRPPLRGPPSLI